MYVYVCYVLATSNSLAASRKYFTPGASCVAGAILPAVQESSQESTQNIKKICWKLPVQHNSQANYFSLRGPLTVWKGNWVIIILFQ
jgi:hypothetical protein